MLPCPLRLQTRNRKWALAEEILEKSREGDATADGMGSLQGTSQPGFTLWKMEETWQALVTQKHPRVTMENLQLADGGKGPAGWTTGSARMQKRKLLHDKEE